MLDIQLIRQNPDKVKKACKDKGVDPKTVDELLTIDKRHRENSRILEKDRHDLNEITEKFKKEKNDEERLKLRAYVQKVIKPNIKKLEPQVSKDKEKKENLLFQIPNLPADDVKPGKDEKENETIRAWGKKPQFDFKAKDHLELAERLDLIDVKRASKVSGTRFGYLKNEAVLL